jgi:FSR family fosmidomycin resistance protein-like MFS transporter
VALAAILGVLHLFVDAATVTVVFRATGIVDVSPLAVVGWIVAYDLLAFGLQPALGWVQDRWGTPRKAMLAGLLLTFSSVAFLQAGASPAVPAVAVVVAATGNALFHLGAGARVLAQGLERAAPIALLVAPGALGLGVGVWFGQHPQAGPVWLVGLPVLAAVVVVSLRPSDRPASGPVGPAGPAPGLVAPVMVGALFLLMTSIGIRSLVGMSASRGYPASAWLLVGVPLVAFAGKLLGGLVADRFGWVRTTVIALVVSAPVLAFTYPHPIVLLGGLFAFQMTMPVTLVAIARLMPHRLATGFGLACLALVLGSLPATFGWGAELTAKPMLGLWVLLSAFAAWAGLTQIGLRWQPRRADGPVDRTPARVPAGATG